MRCLDVRRLRDLARSECGLLSAARKKREKNHGGSNAVEDRRRDVAVSRVYSLARSRAGGRARLPDVPVDAEAKRCGLCKEKKGRSFFPASAWAKRLDSSRRCCACVKKRNEELHPDRGVPGRVVWSRTNPALFVRT